MYRNEETALRERLNATNERIRNVDVTSRRLLVQLEELDRQLQSRGLFTTEPPVLTFPPPVEVTLETPSDELARIAAIREVETERSERELKLLESLVFIQQARLEGRPDHLPLCPAPRDVPKSYLWAEWFTPTFTIYFCFLIIVVFGATMAPAAGTLLWLAGSVAIAYALVRTRRNALERVALLGRCQVARDVSVVRTEHVGSSATSFFGPLEATGWDVRRLPGSEGRLANTLRFTIDDGTTKETTFSGGMYRDGLVLYDAETDRALCVSQLECRPHPDVSGRWVGGLSSAAKISIGATTAALVIWFLTGIASIIVSLLTCGSMVVPFIPFFQYS
jgi:hypothetical protein